MTRKLRNGFTATFFKHVKVFQTSLFFAY